MEEAGSSYPRMWQELDLEESCLGQGYRKARWITGPYLLSMISLRVIPWFFFFFNYVNSCKKKCWACQKRTHIGNIQHIIIFIISLNLCIKAFQLCVIVFRRYAVFIWIHFSLCLKIFFVSRYMGVKPHM